MFNRIRPKSIASSISRKAKASNWIGVHSKSIAAGTAITAGLTTALLEKNFKIPLSLASTYFAYKVKGPLEVLANKGITKQVEKCIGRPRLAKRVESSQKNEFLKFFFNAAGKVSTPQEKIAFTKLLNRKATSTDWISLKRVFSKTHQEIQSEISKSFFLDSKSESVQRILLQKLYKRALSKIRESSFDNMETQYELARITYTPAINLAIRKHASNINPSQRKEVINATKLILERMIQKDRFKSKEYSEDAIMNKEAEVLVKILGPKTNIFTNEAGMIAENLLTRIMPAIQLQLMLDKNKIRFIRKS